MSRLIDLDEAIDYVNDLITVHRFYHPRSTTENFPISEVIAKINEVPTVDVIPVVRCKDCKYADKNGEQCFCKISDYLHWHESDFFCAYGEKVTE